MTDELLPCPFCGHPAEMRPWHGGGPDKRLISCSWGEYMPPHGCPVSPATTGETPAEAIAAWNTRHQSTAPLIEALRDMCAAMEYWAGCDEGCTEDAAASEIKGAGGAWPSLAYAKARALLSAHPVADASPWRPIDSAPEPIDEFSYSETFIAAADDLLPTPCKQRDGEFYDLELVDRDGDWMRIYPTVWQPLPTPPAASAAPGPAQPTPGGEALGVEGEGA